MFTKPIKHVRLKSFDELTKFSHLTGAGGGKPKTYFMDNNGEFVFCDEVGLIWVTPYRSEICEILNEAGYYEEEAISYSITDKEYYKWLRKIADEEKRAKFYENVLKFSEEKGIKTVEIDQKVQIKEIKSKYEEQNKWTLSPMMKIGYFNRNMGTYICLDDKSVLVCDEYGRTFLISAKTTINDVVNKMIDSGYTRTLTPQLYVKDNKTEKNNK